MVSLPQELSFSRISESTTRYTFIPCVGSFTSPGIDTRQKGPPAFIVSSEKHRQMWGEQNCLSFEIAVGRCDWTTVPSIDSPALYRATTAPPDATHCVQYWNVLNETTVQFWKLAQLIFLRMHQNLIFVLLNSDTYNQRKFSSYDMQNTAFTNALEIWIFCKQIS